MAQSDVPQQSAPLRWAVVTPSYFLDFQRCKLLCRSMDQFLAGAWHHYIIVDPVDLPLFRPLAGPRRTVINKQDILPRGFHFGGKIPFLRLGRFWWSLRHGPVFGWQMQQFVKMFMATHLDEEAMLFCDSDVFFLRPFDIGTMAHGQAIRFNREYKPECAEGRDYAASIRLLGLKPKDIGWFWGSEQLVTWHRQTVLDMLDHISRLQGKPWHEAIGMKLSFAEYHLYGTYVNYILKDSPFIFNVENQICKSLWTPEQAAEVNIRDFCATLEPHQAAACIQSLLHPDMRTITEIVEEALATNGNAVAA